MTKVAVDQLVGDGLVIANVRVGEKQWRKSAEDGLLSGIVGTLAPLNKVIFTDIHY